MRKFFALVLLVSVLAFSDVCAQSWVRGFGVSDTRYVVSLNHDSARSRVVYRGIYLTTFPCYSSTATQFYETLPDRNRVQIFCLAPPEELNFSFSLRPIGQFVSRNERWDGYLRCKVNVRGLGVNSVIPRLEVNIDECEHRTLDAAGNANLIRFGGDMIGQPVRDLGAVVAGEATPVIEAGVESDTFFHQTQATEGGSIPYVVNIEVSN
ncbi:MAG: hypothetical protein FWD15_05005 [Alphaproteobacteria bacterium]|nr:hypothetical protein [Alphaproteobacteria bacterium]